MSLEGKLKDFGIADILQLLAQQQKTGILLVERQTESAEIYFFNGQVIETRSSRHSDRLGEMLVRGGYVTRQQVEAALDRQGDTFDYLGGILVRDELIQHDVLQQALLTQMFETFFDILQWRDGQYKFIPEKFKKKGVLENIPGIQSILLDVLRMIDEWPEIAKVIHSFDMLFVLNEGHSPDDIEIDELPVYQLIDGKRSVQEIVDGSLMGRYAACKILVELLQDGIIKPAGRKTFGVPEKSHTVLDILFGPAAYALLLVVCLAVSLYAPSGFPASILPSAFRDGHRPHAIDLYGIIIQQRRIAYGLEAFYFQHAAYPRSLSELINAGLIPAGLPTDIFSYASDSGRYELRHKDTQ